MELTRLPPEQLEPIFDLTSVDTLSRLKDKSITVNLYWNDAARWRAKITQLYDQLNQMATQTVADPSMLSSYIRAVDNYEKYINIVFDFAFFYLSKKAILKELNTYEDIATTIINYIPNLNLLSDIFDINLNRLYILPQTNQSLTNGAIIADRDDIYSVMTRVKQIPTDQTILNLLDQYMPKKILSTLNFLELGQVLSNSRINDNDIKLASLLVSRLPPINQINQSTKDLLQDVLKMNNTYNSILTAAVAADRLDLFDYLLGDSYGSYQIAEDFAEYFVKYKPMKILSSYNFHDIMIILSLTDDGLFTNNEVFMLIQPNKLTSDDVKEYKEDYSNFENTHPIYASVIGPVLERI
jgi:hypothetical protein